MKLRRFLVKLWIGRNWKENELVGFGKNIEGGIVIPRKNGRKFIRNWLIQ